MKGTLALSWGPYGGFYIVRHRICLGWLALTYVPKVEIDDLMEAYASEISGDAREVDGSDYSRASPSDNPFGI